MSPPKNRDHFAEEYRGHKLVATKRGGVFQGVVWKDGKKLHPSVGSSEQDVLQDLRRRVDEMLGSPKREEYAVALEKILRKLSARQKAMLTAHHSAPEQLVSTTELAAAAGYPNYNSANLQYGFVGKALYAELHVELTRMADGSPIYTSALATEGRRAVDEKDWLWKLRPEVAYAIEQVGLAKAK